MGSLTEEERFYYAVQANDVITLRRLVAEGADVNMTFEGLCPLDRPSIWSGLHLCCEGGHYACAEGLLQAGADPDVHDKWSQTPLMYAVKTQRHDLIGLLIRYGADVTNQDSKGRSNVHLAFDVTSGGYHDDFTQCLQHLVTAGADPDLLNDIGQTPLWLAASTDGNVHVMTSLLRTGLCNGSKPDFREKRTALQAAIMHADQDRKEYVRLLLQAGCDVNHRDGTKMTSLMNIMWRSWSHGAEVTSEDVYLCDSIVRQPGCDVNSTRPSGSCIHNWGNALCMAVERGAISLVDLFLLHGANPDVIDGACVPCLAVTCQKNTINMAARLLRANATLNPVRHPPKSPQCPSYSPFHTCILRGHLDLALVLVECGYDLNREPYILTNEDVPEYLLRNTDVLYLLRDYRCTPASLVDLSRRAVRVAMGQVNFLQKARSLGVAGYIVELLLCEDILSTWL